MPNKSNSMLFDLIVEDKTHTTLYVKTRYTIYCYDVLNANEARALIQLIKESINWNLYTQNYDARLFYQFRQEWPETLQQINYNPNY